LAYHRGTSPPRVPWLCVSASRRVCHFEDAITTKTFLTCLNPLVGGLRVSHQTLDHGPGPVKLHARFFPPIFSLLPGRDRVILAKPPWLSDLQRHCQNPVNSRENGSRRR